MTTIENVQRRNAARLQLAEADRLRPDLEVAGMAADKAALKDRPEKSGERDAIARQIDQLKQEAHEELFATADASLQERIDQLDSRLSEVQQSKSLVKFSPTDPMESARQHNQLDTEASLIRSRIAKLRVQQLA